MGLNIKKDETAFKQKLPIKPKTESEPYFKLLKLELAFLIRPVDLT
jgi:hypothetical protein